MLLWVWPVSSCKVPWVIHLLGGSILNKNRHRATPCCITNKESPSRQKCKCAIQAFATSTCTLTTTQTDALTHNTKDNETNLRFKSLFSSQPWGLVMAWQQWWLLAWQDYSNLFQSVHQIFKHNLRFCSIVTVWKYLKFAKKSTTSGFEAKWQYEWIWSLHKSAPIPVSVTSLFLPFPIHQWSAVLAWDLPPHTSHTDDNKYSPRMPFIICKPWRWLLNVSATLGMADEVLESRVACKIGLP